MNHPEPIGGEDRVVEIDESLLARRKYNRGRIVKEQWIVGGYDAVEKKGFLIPVPARDAGTLLPNSTAMGDAWLHYTLRHVAGV